MNVKAYLKGNFVGVIEDDMGIDFDANELMEDEYRRQASYRAKKALRNEASRDGKRRGFKK